MDNLLEDADTSERVAKPAPHRLVMIARQIDDACAAVRALEQPLQNRIVLVGPKPLLLQPPTVYDVADQIKVVGLDLMQEIKQTVGFAATRSKMEVGYEHRPIMPCDAVALDNVGSTFDQHGSSRAAHRR